MLGGELYKENSGKTNKHTKQGGVISPQVTLLCRLRPSLSQRSEVNIWEDVFRVGIRRRL